MGESGLTITASRSQPQPSAFPPGYRPAGAAPGFPPIGQLGRAAPPGFGGRSSAGGKRLREESTDEAHGAETSDFPALGSHNSTYASQTSHPTSTASSSQHLPPQQLFMQGAPGLAPPPPPGIGTSPGQHPNGLADDFPALSGGAGGEAKDRISNFLRAQPSTSQSPPSLINGTGSATPSTSPSREIEPVLRPVQQVYTSPADRWGLKALLYEIQMNARESDRGTLLFGEDLVDLGVDLGREEPLYETLVTPWANPSSLDPQVQLDERFHIPQCYNVSAPAVQSKIPNFTEDTLLYAFYASPQDTLQLEVAEELYNRGWRYHIELQVWLLSSSAANVAHDIPSPNWIRGPFIIFDPRRFERTKTPDDFMIDGTMLEPPRSAAAYIKEEQSRKESNPIGNGHAR